MITQEQCEAIEALGEKYPDHYMAKFCVDPMRWDREAEAICNQIGPVGDILDIGCGFGYFLSQYDGITVGLDVDEQIIQDASLILGVPVGRDTVRGFTPLDLAKCHYYFDTITMFGCMLRNHHPAKSGGYWCWDEYRYFICDILSHLRNGGRFVIRPNVMADPRPYHADLLDVAALDKAIGDIADIEYEGLQITLRRKL